MRRIGFNPRFVNEAGNDLIAGKIHTIRQNYWFWKRFEGQDVALYTWEGNPYRSKQRVFCVKRIVSVEKIFLKEELHGKKIRSRKSCWFEIDGNRLSVAEMAKNDGFSKVEDFKYWFWFYPAGEMAVLHFTEFRYG
jgi:hypothetical protein